MERERERERSERGCDGDPGALDYTHSLSLSGPVFLFSFFSILLFLLFVRSFFSSQPPAYARRHALGVGAVTQRL